MQTNTTLYDAYDRPVKRQDLRREIAAPRVGGLRNIWADSVASGLTPGRLATLLQGALDGDAHDFLTLAEEIEERDHHYRSVLSTRKLAVSGLEVTVEAASDEKRGVELADEVRGLIRDPGFGHAVFDLLDAIGKGYSAVEIIWETTAARWKPRYAWRDPRFFQFDRETRTELRVRDEAAPLDGLPLPPYKFITHLPHLKTGIPIRRGLARLAVWAYLFKAYTLKDWMAFIEVFGMPLRLGRYGHGATNEDIGKLVSAVVNLGADAAAVIPQSMQIEFQNAVQGSGNNQVFEKAAEFWDKQVSKAVLGQTASTEGTPGKLGNEDAQDEVRQDLIKADAKDLSHTLNRDLVRPFIDLNFGPQEVYPRLVLFVPEPEDIAQLTTSLKELVPLGLKVEQSVVRDKLGLPDPGEGAELLGVPAPAPPPDEGKAENRTHTCPFAAQGLALNIQDATEDDLAELEALALEDWEEQMGPLLEPLKALVASAESYEEVLEKLPGLLPEMNADQLVEQLAGAMFKARGLS